MSRSPGLCGFEFGRNPLFWGLHLWLWVLAAVVGTASWDCAIDEPVRATRESALSAPAEGISTLEVRNRIGRIDVTGYDGADVQVRLVVKVRAASDERAEALAREVTLRPTVEGDTLKLSPLLPNLGHREQIEVELDVSVPWPRAAADSPAAATQPSAAARSVDCHTDVGRIRVRDVAAAVDADASTGAIKVENVSGPVNAETQTGTVRVRAVNGKVTATSTTGSVTVADVRGPVRATTSTGSIDVSHVDCRQAGQAPQTAVWAHATTGSVCVQDVTGNVEATTSVGRVSVSDVRGTVKAHSALGKVVRNHIEEPADSD